GGLKPAATAFAGRPAPPTRRAPSRASVPCPGTTPAYNGRRRPSRRTARLPEGRAMSDRDPVTPGGRSDGPGFLLEPLSLVTRLPGTPVAAVAARRAPPRRADRRRPREEGARPARGPAERPARAGAPARRGCFRGRRRVGVSLRPSRDVLRPAVGHRLRLQHDL